MEMAREMISDSVSARDASATYKRSRSRARMSRRQWNGSLFAAEKGDGAYRAKTSRYEVRYHVSCAVWALSTASFPVKKAS